MRISDWSSDVCSSDLPATLCVDNQCGEKTVLLTIPSAENILFADDGRLFVSGGSNVFEITRDDDAYTATALYDRSCNFTGMAIVGEALYAACFDGQLYAAQLDAHPALQPIHALGLGAPNRSEERRVGKEGVSTGRSGG